MITAWIIALLVMWGILAFFEASLSVWSVTWVMQAWIITHWVESDAIILLLWMSTALIIVVLNVPFLRKRWISAYLLTRFKSIMPKMSTTEREALAAGTVGWEGQLFNGNPDFHSLLRQPKSVLQPEETAFLNNELNELCRCLDDWEMTHRLVDLPPKAWEMVRQKGFLGLIIPKNYGGKGFSASAVSEILTCLASKSLSAAAVVGVANSLGPAELLLHYGTEEQKTYYLPRLASGDEIPCFALTSPEAGSDAAAIPDTGVVCRQQWNGSLTLGIRLNWNKRYITLCPAATVIGLAFHLLDPDHLLGEKEDIGITCALIPANTPGVIKGRRHFPMNMAFLNGPTQGKDVFIPLDWVIGGKAMAGQGWRMLMECLSAGRAIALPSNAAGSSQAAALACGAYARIREQFGLPIAQFEGIEEVLGNVGGLTYIINAVLSITVSAIDQGAKPAVASAIVKYHTTELARKVCFHAMDLHGGKAICLGPNNYLGRSFESIPIGITVEGANILTRDLMIYGQGAIRCHPYLWEEIDSIQQNDLARFDRALFGHAGSVISHTVRAFVFGLTGGRGSTVPAGPLKPYFQKMLCYSVVMAFLSDMSMVLYGAQLKRKERISARLGDVLSYLYLLSAVAKKYYNDGAMTEDFVLVEWSCQMLFYAIEEAIFDWLNNIPSILLRVMLRMISFPFGRRCKKPLDKMERQIAVLMTQDTQSRQRLSAAVFKEPLDNHPLGRLEEAFKRVLSVEPIAHKIRQAAKNNIIQGFTRIERMEAALAKNIISAQEAQLFREAETARQAILAVDDFDAEDLMRK